MQNGPNRVMIDSDTHVPFSEGKIKVRDLDVIFIKSDLSIGATKDLAEDAYLIAPEEWLGVIQKPQMEVYVPSYWFKQWHTTKNKRQDA